MGALIQLGDFVLRGGGRGDFKLAADGFVGENLAGLVALARKLVGPFGSVEGVPRGGTLLADALKGHAVAGYPHLIVDDVLTTGGSMARAREAWRSRAGDRYSANVVGCSGLVVFARGFPPAWVVPIFQMPEGLWAGPPVEGSR